VAGSGDVQNDPGTDDYGQIRTDFDAQPGHGKGSFDIFARNLGNLRDDGKGNLVISKPNPAFDPGQPESENNPKMVPVTDKNGLPAFSIAKADASLFTQRVNAARIAGGQPYLGNLPDGTNPNSGQPSGTKINPVPVNDNLTLRSLPYNTWMRMPDGSIRPKQPLGQGQPQPSAQGQPQQPQASVDTGDQPEDVAANAPAPSDQDVNIPPGVADQVRANANAQPAAQSLVSVSPQQAGQNYLQSLGLGAGAGQLYPASDLYG
jgi:hypothetical protein